MENEIFVVVLDYGYDGIGKFFFFTTEEKANEYANGYQMSVEECIYIVKRKIDEPEFEEKTNYLRRNK